jgi:hypothetical protein
MFCRLCARDRSVYFTYSILEMDWRRRSWFLGKHGCFNRDGPDHFKGWSLLVTPAAETDVVSSPLCEMALDIQLKAVRRQVRQTGDVQFLIGTTTLVT